MARKNVVEAARALSAVCDGAHSRDHHGFNGADAPFAKSVLSQRLVTPKQARCLHRLLEKYRKQLATLGFDYDTLEVPSDLTPTDPDARRIGQGWTAKPIVENKPEPRPEPAPAPRPVSPPKARPESPEWNFEPEAILARFPEGFRPRPQQEAAIRQINAAYRAGKRVVVLEMPTGGGKSFICYAFAAAVADVGRTHFLTIQKTLQDQYTRDFPSPKLEVLKGRANYPCPKNSENCANGSCTERKKGILLGCLDAPPGWPVDEDGDPKGLLAAAVQLELEPCYHRCPYWKQLQICHDHRITLFNFSSFLFQQRIGRFGHRNLMIVDEGHNVESQLMNFVSMELTEWALSIIGVRINRRITSKEQFVEWLREEEVLTKIGDRLKEMAEYPGDESIPEDLSRAETECLKELQGKLGNFMRFLDKTEWVLETQDYRDRRGESTRKIVARPLYAKDFANDLLFDYADRILVMSATILDVDVWAENLGLARDEVALVQTPNEFPVENRLIHMEYAGNMGRKWFSPEQNPQDPTKPKFVRKIKQIMERHQGQRGIIHCHSFELARILREEVADPRFLFQDDYKGDKQAMLADHAERTDSVIVAPAMHEGYDLRDGLSRFQVIAKVPWPSLGDKVVKERASRDDRWYAWLTALKIVQSYGRSIRSKDDWAMTYIIDSGFDGFYGRHGGRMIPRWFAEALKKYAPKEIRRDS